MSLTELKVVVTEQNAAIVAEFIKSLASAAPAFKAFTDAVEKLDVVDAEEVKAESEAPKKEPAKRASRAKKPEPVAEEVETEELDDELEEETTHQAANEAPSITADDLRELQAKKVGAHRDAIIKKLNGLGAKNITSLDESKFVEYYNFLAELA